jgi:hypothetical protein
VARNNETGKSYKVADMQLCEEDEILKARERFEIGSIIKDWSKEKA